MKMDNNNKKITSKFRIIYYINNMPLLNLQLLTKELKLICVINYFDSKKVFLQLEYNCENNTVPTLLCEEKPSQSFLVPVAVCINGGVLTIAAFLNLFKNQELESNHDNIIRNLLQCKSNHDDSMQFLMAYLDARFLTINKILERCQQ